MFRGCNEHVNADNEPVTVDNGPTIKGYNDPDKTIIGFINRSWRQKYIYRRLTYTTTLSVSQKLLLSAIL